MIAKSSPSRTGSDRIAAALRAEITSGQLRPGGRVRQRDVAQRFGVSTTPVREALATLQREGLVQIQPHRGATVFAPSEAELRDHYDVRIALECLAGRRAARFCAAADARRLQGLLDRLGTTDDPALYVQLNQHFHAELYALGGNPQLCTLIASLRDRDRAYLVLYATRRLPSVRLNAEHQEILDACAAGAEDACEDALREHLKATVEQVTQLLRRSSP